MTTPPTNVSLREGVLTLNYDLNLWTKVFLHILLVTVL